MKNKYKVGDKITFKPFSFLGTIISWFSEEALNDCSIEVEKNKMDIKSGDKITVELEVHHVYTHYVSACRNHTGGVVYISKEDIISHTPKKEEFKIGDKVKSKHTNIEYEVIGIYEDKVWCKRINFIDNTTMILDIDNVTKVN